MQVSLAGGVASIPVDFLVRVLDTLYDPTSPPRNATGPAYALSQTTFAGNTYVPILRVFGSVEASARGCSARMTRLPSGEHPMDITALAHPCALTTYTGSEVRFRFDGLDLQDDNSTQVNPEP